MNELTVEDVAAVNTVAAFLALDDAPAGPYHMIAELAVLAGHAVLPSIEGALALARARQLPLLITGGHGHSTPFLAAALAAHPTYSAIPTKGRSEAEMLGDLATGFWGIDTEQLILEPHARHCGENAAFTRDLLAARNWHPEALILVQDPLLQRRTDATFRQAWSALPSRPTFINWPVFTPTVALADNGTLHYASDRQSGLWPMPRFLGLLMGEIPRLIDYGPTGLGHIAPVAVPPDVAQAYALLATRHPEWSMHRN